MVGAVSIGSFEGSRFVRGGRYGVSIDFGLEVVEKENACWETFKSKFVDLTMKRKLTIRLIVTRDGQFFKTAGLEPLMPLGSGTRQRPPQSGLVQTPQGLRMLLGAFRGGNPLGRGRDGLHRPPPAQIRASASTHTALTKDEWRRSEPRDRDAGCGALGSICRRLAYISPTSFSRFDCGEPERFAIVDGGDA